MIERVTAGCDRPMAGTAAAIEELAQGVAALLVEYAKVARHLEAGYLA